MKGNIAILLLDIYREALKRNINKKFINLIFSKSNISILNEQIFITSYDIKTRLLQLDKGIIFKNIKNILEDIYSNVKKNIRYII